MTALFERLPANFKPGDILSLGRSGNLYPAGANGSDGQFLYRSGGLWVPRTLIAGDIPDLRPTYFPAWTAYTPTFAPTSGTFGSASTSGRWVQIGKTLFLTALCTITTNGTGSGFLQFTLPNSLTAVGLSPLNCRETAVGQIYTAYGQTSSNQVIILPYNSNGYAGADAKLFYINGTLEVN